MLLAGRSSAAKFGEVEDLADLDLSGVLTEVGPGRDMAGSVSRRRKQVRNRVVALSRPGLHRLAQDCLTKRSHHAERVA